jgi:adenosylmethionine-8-amino-7-oxononanoate aminotransferase
MCDITEKMIKKDLKYLWHPYTQMKDCEAMPPIPIKKAAGIKLYDYEDNFYYDTISSWWCNVHGHGHPAIRKAVKDQLDKLEHVLFAGFTHGPAIALAEKLVEISPPGLTRVFYSDNGSTAVEVALKMSFQYWRNRAEKNRTAFLSFDRAYHGDTVGAMSVSGVDAYNRLFEQLFFKSFKTKVPFYFNETPRADKKALEEECYSRIRKILEKNQERIAAVIAEPLLLCAGGMLVYSPEFLKRVRKLTREFNTHLILDEVATGFGRTGKMFACEHAGIVPDFMCVSKGITGGFFPLGATLTVDDIYNAFYDDYVKNKTFFHGHTYTANPVSCRAANASIELFKKENTLSNVSYIEKKIQNFLADLQKMEVVSNTRCIGAVGAFDINKSELKNTGRRGYERTGFEIYRRALKKNLLLRPLGDTIYLFLPLCANKEELEDIFTRTFSVIEEINAG